MTDFEPEAVVIDAGTFPTSPIALHWLDVCGDKVVCCDGAANDFIAHGHIPWRIVGDCDSLSPLIKENYKSIIRQIGEQESNDQTKAIRYLAKKGFKRVVILGATGKREDHTIGNISLLIDYLHHGITARIYTDYGVFIPAIDAINVHCPLATQISIFNFGATDLSAEGLRYPLRDFTSWWQGTLNETTLPDIRITAHGPFMIYLACSRFL